MATDFEGGGVITLVAVVG
ncbi:Protein of unknown function [Pyronema omphalodes CBS 100304]|uniref:Uncharacterized protein n=1 Tax=Pyronema omphalodes (strain CBS 100304) TaxID=1076935 RepID=U4LIV6_PYROM|nr:Protein of unknown function [Pyronema omphalodes CBS 100304]